jgi:outer membrane protein OmpA-like peptidoglycan-associated protein
MRAPVVAMLLLVPAIAGALKILQPLTFARGSARLDDGARDVADATAEIMRDYPEIQLIEIQGHASDDDGATDAARLAISDARAMTVRDRMVTIGIAPERLQVQGYGDTQPVDRHHSELARSKNRRVAFLILKRRADD